MARSFCSLPAGASAIPALALLMCLSVPAVGDPQGPGCGAPEAVTRFEHPLEHVLLRIAQGGPLKIIAFGSSSTWGTGATTRAGSYPSQLEAELKARFPGVAITVVNRGVGGEDARQMLARLEQDVIDQRPDLVLWQVGTNAVLRDREMSTQAPLIREGIDRLKATGADIVLINPQYAPKVIVKPFAEAMVDFIGVAARAEGVELFDRFALMRYWVKSNGMSFEQFLSPDGLHMNDWSYACVARALAGAISRGAKPPAATARAPGVEPPPVP